jgi:hypothetical protein
MFYRNALALGLLLCSASAAAAPPLTYDIIDLCAPHSCVARLLNNNGTVVGYLLDAQPTTFVIPFGKPLVNFTQLTGLVLGVNHINDSEVMVGNYLPPDDPLNYHAFAYAAQTGVMFDLNDVFGWTSGDAFYINNKGDITGSPSPFGSTVIANGTVFSWLWMIGDNNVALGYVSSSFTSPPNVVTAAAPDGSVTRSAGSICGFNCVTNQAQALVTSANGTRLFTPGIGDVPISYISGMSPVALSDSGLVVAVGSISISRPTYIYLYDASGQIAQLSQIALPLVNLITPAFTNWTINQVEAINSQGQILALAYDPNGRFTTVLLSPTSGVFPPQSERPGPAALGEHKLTAGCLINTLNHTGLNCGHHPAVYRREMAPR